MKNFLNNIGFTIMAVTFVVIACATPKTASATLPLTYHHSIYYTVIAPPPEVITVTLTANPTVINLPGDPSQSTLTWTTTGSPTDCQASNAWSGTKDPAGNSELITGLTNPGTYTFHITCTKANATPADAEATVTVNTSAPGISAWITAVENPLPFGGGTSHLNWGSANATSCSGTNFNTGGSTSGLNLPVSLTTTTTYYLDCTHSSTGFHAYAQVTILVGSKVTPVFGVCTTSHYFCIAGTSINQVEGPTGWSWQCAGSGGGSTDSCFESNGGCTGKGCGGGGDTQCSNGSDDDGDTFIDINDPACHTDCAATNPASYNAALDNESKICVKPKYIEL